MKRSPIRRGSGLKRSGITPRGLAQLAGSGEGQAELRKRVGMTTRGPIKSFGRITEQRRLRRQQWELDHPPLKDYYDNEFYLCHICIYFNEPIKIQKVTIGRMILDHIDAKGHLSLEDSEKDENLGPSHWICNGEKGSQQLCQMMFSPISHLPNPHLDDELPF